MSASERLNQLRLSAVDLRNHIRLGIRHIYHCTIDHPRRCMPLASFNLLEPPVNAWHEGGGCPHLSGRFLDALAVSSTIVDLPVNPQIDEGLAWYVYDSLDNPLGLPFANFVDKEGERMAHMHDCREVLLALVALWQWKGSERAKETAARFVRSLEQITRQAGAFPGSNYSERKGWHGEETNHPNTTSGRLIGALIKYYRATDDALAVELARRLADDNIARTFTPAGELTDLAGSHLHSIEGTVTGILDLGVVSGERSYFDVAKAVYDHGIVPWRTSFGWAKESRSSEPDSDPACWKVRAEANNTGDLIEAAAILGANGYPEYYQQAECMIRNGLLASQVIDTGWVPEHPDPPADTETCIYDHQEVCRRAVGLFCFSTPNGFQSYNTDLVGGAVQSLCEAYHASTTGDDDHTRVNMLFTTDSPHASVESSVPEAGRLSITTRQDGKLSVFAPDWIEDSTVEISVDRRERSVTRQGRYFVLERLEKGAKVDVSFEQPARHTAEYAAGYPQPFEIDWLGDTITAMQPVPKLGRLY